MNIWFYNTINGIFWPSRLNESQASKMAEFLPKVIYFFAELNTDVNFDEAPTRDSRWENVFAEIRKEVIFDEDVWVVRVEVPYKDRIFYSRYIAGPDSIKTDVFWKVHAMEAAIDGIDKELDALDEGSDKDD